MLKAPEIQSYIDLWIHLWRTDDGQVQVRMESPAGAFEGSLRLYLDPQEVKVALASAARTGSAYLKRSGSIDSLDPVRDVGAQLFEALFEGRRESLYRHSLRMAEEKGVGLRLRLQVDDDKLAALPWEFLYDGRDFVSLSPWSPVVRSRPLAQAPRLLDSLSRLRLCIMTADVTGGMQTEREIEALQGLDKGSSQLEIDVVQEVTWPRFREVVARDDFDVLHFIGVGSGGGAPDDAQVLVLMGTEQDPTQESQGVRPYELVRTATLADALRSGQRLRLIVFSADDTDRIAGELTVRLGGSGPAVVGWRGSPSIYSCIAFSEGLYRGILAGLPLEAAVNQGRQEIDRYSPGSREWGLPVLYMGASDGLMLSRPSTPLHAEVVPEGALDFSVPEPPPDPSSRREWEKVRMMLEIRERNLQALEEQRASYRGTVPAVVETQIDETKAEIADLQARLGSIESGTG